MYFRSRQVGKSWSPTGYQTAMLTLCNISFQVLNIFKSNWSFWKNVEIFQNLQPDFNIKNSKWGYKTWAQLAGNPYWRGRDWELKTFPTRLIINSPPLSGRPRSRWVLPSVEMLVSVPPPLGQYPSSFWHKFENKGGGYWYQHIHWSVHFLKDARCFGSTHFVDFVLRNCSFWTAVTLRLLNRFFKN